ncbi:MAG: hypothetical protein ACTSRW_07110 [Candidatus Helarchaeota archaeon]
MSVPQKRFIIRNIITVGKWDWNEKKKCIVCNLIIKDDDDEIVTCPHCRKQAHKKHMLDWLKIRAVCPNCKKKIRQRDLI